MGAGTGAGPARASAAPQCPDQTPHAGLPAPPAAAAAAPEARIDAAKIWGPCWGVPGRGSASLSRDAAHPLPRRWRLQLRGPPPPLRTRGPIMGGTAARGWGAGHHLGVSGNASEGSPSSRVPGVLESGQSPFHARWGSPALGGGPAEPSRGLSGAPLDLPGSDRGARLAWCTQSPPGRRGAEVLGVGVCVCGVGAGVPGPVAGTSGWAARGPPALVPPPRAPRLRAGAGARAGRGAYLGQAERGRIHPGRGGRRRPAGAGARNLLSHFSSPPHPAAAAGALLAASSPGRLLPPRARSLSAPPSALLSLSLRVSVSPPSASLSHLPPSPSPPTAPHPTFKETREKRARATEGSRSPAPCLLHPHPCAGDERQPPGVRPQDGVQRGARAPGPRRGPRAAQPSQVGRGRWAVARRYLGG